MRKKTLSGMLATFGLAALSAGLVAAAPAGRVQAERGEDGGNLTSLSEKTFTKPSEDIPLDFSSPGLVEKVNVKEGDVVKAGDVLAVQDVSVEAANKAMYEIEAKSNVEVEYAEKDFGVKTVKYQRMQQLRQQKNATELEEREAQLEMERADASVKLAEQKRATARAQAAIEDAKIKLKQIKSPVDGIVQKLDTHVGEVAKNEQNKPAIRVVRNDVLWIDAHLPAAAVDKLKKGQKLQVRYATEDRWQTADILYLQPVVRYGSQTRQVRLQLANADGRPAGLEVFVKLPDGSVASGDDAAAQPRAVADR